MVLKSCKKIDKNVDNIFFRKIIHYSAVILGLLVFFGASFELCGLEFGNLEAGKKRNPFPVLQFLNSLWELGTELE